MPRQFHIRVYGAQRKNIDPALLAQLVILFGRHLAQQRQQQHSNHRTAKDTTASQAHPSTRHPEDHPVPPPDDTPLRNNDGEVS